MKCAHCGLENPDSAQICDCGFNFETRRMGRPIQTQSANTLVEDSADKRAQVRALAQGIGLLFVIAGLLVSGYFAIFYDSSIAVPPTTTASAEVGDSAPAPIPDRVINLGLAQTKQSGISSGLQVSILGALLLLYGKE
jgi:hypothetical protein